MNPHRLVWSRFRTFRLVGVVGMALVLGAVVAWSSAGVRHSATPRFTLKAIPVSQVHPSWQVPRIRNANGTSSNWSGYAVVPITQGSNSPKNGNGKGNGKGGGKPSGGGSGATFSDVTGSWAVPTVVASSSANTYSSTWVGLDGYADSTVEQIGIDQDCSNGTPQYYAWFEMYPKFAYEIGGFPVNPDDVINAEVQYGRKGTFTLTITNSGPDGVSGPEGYNGPVTFTTTQRASSAQRLSAEWIEEAPWSGGVLPLADFGTVDFAGCSATMGNNTGTISGSAWQNDAIKMESSGGALEAEPSGLSPDGSAFSVTWYSE